MVGEQVSSISSENKSIKSKVKDLSDEEPVEDVNTDLEVPALPQPKGRVKKSVAEGNTVKVDTKMVTVKQKLSIKSDGVSGAVEFIDFFFLLNLVMHMINISRDYFSLSL